MGIQKFIHQQELDQTAKNPIYATLRCAPTLYKALHCGSINANAWFEKRDFIPVIEPTEIDTVAQNPKPEAVVSEKETIIEAQVKLSSGNGDYYFQVQYKTSNTAVYCTTNVFVSRTIFQKAKPIYDLLPKNPSFYPGSVNPPSFVSLYKMSHAFRQRGYWVLAPSADAAHDTCPKLKCQWCQGVSIFLGGK